MGIVRTFPVEDVIKRGSIRANDVAGLRFAVYEDGLIGADEAERLIELNRRCPVQDHSWAELFLESITDYLVNQAKPEGYVTADNAAWLISRIATDGAVATKSELELLVNVIDRARWAPVSLSRLALDQVRLAVASGAGPLRDADGVGAGSITSSEIELLRRIVYAYGGDGNIAVTRDEAEVLFAINDALGPDYDDAEWRDLFVKAITNVVMAASGYNVPTREEALQREQILDNPAEKVSPAAMLVSMVRAGLGGLHDAYALQTAEERALARLERQRIEIITGEAIASDEATWIGERLGRDGVLSVSERALVAHLISESPSVDPALGELLQKLGGQAPTHQG